MKKIYWRIGTYFLRKAGLKIAEESFKYYFNPISLGMNFKFPKGEKDETVAEKRIREAEWELFKKTRPYIYTEHTDKGDYLDVRMSLMVQWYVRSK